MELWTCAFSPGAWILIIGTLAVFVVSLKSLHNFSSILQEFLNVVTIIVGQFPSRVKGLYFGIAFWTMLIANLYENSITSSVTVKTPPSSYNTIKEILDEGYKFAWIVFAGSRDVSPEDYYAVPFEQKHIQIDMADAFQVFNVTTSMESREKGALLRKQNIFVMTNQVEGAYGPTYEYFANYRSKRQYQCRFVKEPINTPGWYWAMYTVNPDWMLETAARVRESGLWDKIYEWSDRAYFFQEDHQDFREYLRKATSKPVVEPDVIKLYKLVVPIAFMCIWIVSSFVVLLCEIHFSGEGRSWCMNANAFRMWTLFLGISKCKNLRMYLICNLQVEMKK